MTFDLILKGGWVIDGSGGPAFRADVALIDTMIAEVGRLEGAEAARVRRRRGALRRPRLHRCPRPRRPHAPGRSDSSAGLASGRDNLPDRPGRQLVRPGVARTLDYMRRYTAGFNGNPAGLSYDWRTVDEYLARFDRRVAINVAYLIPNGNVRMEVMGLDPRPARDDELRAMQKLVREGMDAGAIGLSTGLDYIPSLYADAREIAALCEPIVAENGVYVTHMRGYGPRAAVGMREVYDIARATGVPAHVSHYNGRGRSLAPPDRRRAGARARPDVRHLSLPGGEHDPRHGRPAGLGPGRRDRAHRRAAARPGRACPAQLRMVLERHALRAREHHDRHGGSPRLAVGRGTDRRGGGRAGEARLPAISSARSCRPATWRSESWPFAPAIEPRPTSGRSSAIPRTWRAPTASSAAAFPHPRGWGAFARYLGYHTRQLGDYSWPEAVTHLATHAARRFRLTDRGLIRPGFVADIAVLDPASVTDRSTYAAGRTLAEGVDHVLVNGTLALENGEPTGATPGRALRRG